MQVVHTEVSGACAIVRIDNPPVNATSTRVRAALLQAISKVQKCERAILTATGRTFVAGGDMTEFDQDPEPPHLPDVVQAIEDSETPFVAALHGNVLGGGLELAMACVARVAAPYTRFGLPEVNIGLVPGAYQFPTHDSVIISCALMVRFRCIRGTKIVHATRNSRIPRSGCRFELWNPALRPLIRGLSGSAELSATRQQAAKVRNAESSVSY